jgi:hypothetical protein
MAAAVSTSQRQELPRAGHLQLAPVVLRAVVLRAAVPSCSAAERREGGALGRKTQGRGKAEGARWGERGRWWGDKGGVRLTGGSRRRAFGMK